MCSTCSKVRCKVYGLVAGVKTEFQRSCGTYCYVEQTDEYLRLGDSWSSFPSFLKKLGSAFVGRFRK